MTYFDCQINDLIRIINPNCESIMPNSIWRVLGEDWEEGESMPHLIIQGHNIWGEYVHERDWYCDEEDYIVAYG